MGDTSFPILYHHLYRINIKNIKETRKILNELGLQRGGGLLKLPKDKRDLDFGKIADLNPEMLGTLPDNFENSILYYHHQKRSEKCTGYSVAEVSEDQEGLPLHPDIQYMFGKLIRWGWDNVRGAIDAWGNDMRSAVKGATKYGSVFLNDYPDLVLGKKSSNWLTNWHNYPKELWEKAKEHKKESYFRIKRGNGLDIFDVIKLALWNNRALKRSIVAGAMWQAHWSRPPQGIVPIKVNRGTYGHMFKLFGFTKIANIDYIKVFPNYGKEYGLKGVLYFPREVVNREFFYGAYAFVDMPLDLAKLLNQYTGKVIGEGKPPLFIVKNGKKRYIPSQNFLNALGFEDKRGVGGWEVISPQEFKLIPEGDPITHKNLTEPQKELFHRNKLA